MSALVKEFNDYRTKMNEVILKQKQPGDQTPMRT
jgi:hypothetical protein